jgi:hypothetical protein
MQFLLCKNIPNISQIYLIINVFKTEYTNLFKYTQVTIYVLFKRTFFLFETFKSEPPSLLARINSQN